MAKYSSSKIITTTLLTVAMLQTISNIVRKFLAIAYDKAKN